MVRVQNDLVARGRNDAAHAPDVDPFLNDPTEKERRKSAE